MKTLKKMKTKTTSQFSDWLDNAAREGTEFSELTTEEKDDVFRLWETDKTVCQLADIDEDDIQDMITEWSKMLIGIPASGLAVRVFEVEQNANSIHG